MYGCYLLCMLLAFVKPILGICLIGSSARVHMDLFLQVQKESENDSRTAVDCQQQETGRC